ncbi:MAG: cytidine deaminase, partial [Bradymonadaceae bacterium]
MAEHDDRQTVPDEAWDQLYERAREVKQQAWVPYSGFPVGAALLCESGEIVTGCNVENASIGATVCAERTALGAAVSRGERSFRALCVVTDAEPPAAPCGICRQTLSEFCEELPILLANEAGDREETTLAEI